MAGLQGLIGQAFSFPLIQGLIQFALAFLAAFQLGE